MANGPGGTTRWGGDPGTERSGHVVQLYEHESHLIECAARFVGSNLGAGDVALVVATTVHREALGDRLAADGFDVSCARRQGRYLALDAGETLATFMRNGWPDADRFSASVGRLLERTTARGRRGVRAFGEMVNVLWDDGEREAAIHLERLWNLLGHRVPFLLLCAYPMTSFADEANAARMAAVCDAHSTVVPAESYTGLGPDARLRRIAELQQKARALEGEIARRRDVEEALRDRNRTLEWLNHENARLYEVERRARDDAEATSRAKDEFLAMLAHELRNPLSAVRNAIVVAQLDSARTVRALEIAGRGTEQLSRLVDDLLDVARVTHGRITLQVERLAFADVVARAIESARPLVDERAHTLAVSLETDGLAVEGDATRLEQVVVNLLTNAAKFTPPHGRIAVRTERRDDEAVLRICDDGIGLAAEMLPRVFDLFAQGDHGLDRGQGGLGVGLTVVKRLVELHGGRVEAHSDGPGTGAEFVVRLPAATTDEQSSAISPPDVEPTVCARVLIVEDDVDIAEGLEALLELVGHRVRVATDGQSALALARIDRPDVMLIDIGLPGMDGYEVARHVRADDHLTGVRLVALTGYGRDEDRAEALRAGFDRHLVKPLEPDALEAVIAQCTSPASRG